MNEVKINPITHYNKQFVNSLLLVICKIVPYKHKIKTINNSSNINSTETSITCPHMLKDNTSTGVCEIYTKMKNNYEFNEQYLCQI